MEEKVVGGRFSTSARPSKRKRHVEGHLGHPRHFRPPLGFKLSSIRGPPLSEQRTLATGGLGPAARSRGSPRTETTGLSGPQTKDASFPSSNASPAGGKVPDVGTLAEAGHPGTTGAEIRTCHSFQPPGGWLCDQAPCQACP